MSAINIWHQGVAEGIRDLEENGFLVRKTIPKTYNDKTKQQGSVTERVRGAHIVAIPVTQFSARHTDETIARGGPPDAHLHTHVAIATMAWLPDDTHPDGMRPLTIDHKSVVNMEEQVGATASGVVAKGLEEMGIELVYSQTQRGTVNWKIKGVAKEAERFHSTNSGRRVGIEEAYEAKYGKPATRPQVDEMMRKSRHSKSQTGLDKEADTKGAWHTWLAQLKAHGIDLGLMKPGKPIVRETVLQRKQQLFDRLMAPTGLVKEHAYFTADTILKSIKIAGVGLGFTQEELAAMEPGIRNELRVVRKTNDERFTYYTTKVELVKEDRIERGIDSFAAKPDTLIDYELAERVLASQPYELDPQQRAAFYTAIKQRVTFIEGVAGAGKSSTIKAIVDYHQQAGIVDQAVVTSTSAKVAQDTGIKTGADAYGAVESIESQVKNKRIIPSDRNVYVIDESAMMENDKIDRLLMAAQSRGKFIFVGDPAQLSSIGAGGWYQDSVKKHGSVTLEKSHRFDGPEAEADVRDYTLLRNGNIEDARQAVENLHKRGRIHESETADERVHAMFAKYEEIRDAHPEVKADDIRVLIDGSNRDVDSLARHVQFYQHQRSEIGKGVRLHDEESGRHWSLHENESVVFQRSYMGSGKDDQAIKNGTTARILSIDEETREAKVQLADRETTIKLNEFEEKQPIAPAGAQHAAKAQGGEYDYVLTAPGTRTATANSAYSQLTRAKKEAHTFLDHETHGESPRETIAESWAERVDKRTARSMLREQGEGIGLETPYEKTTAGRGDEERHQPATEAERPSEARPTYKPAGLQQSPVAVLEKDERQETTRDRVKDRELRREQSPVAETKIQKPSSVVEKEEAKPVEEPEQQQPREPEAERQREQGSLRERFTHLRDRGRARSQEREEQRSPAEKESTHLRERGQDHGRDMGR